MFKYLIPLLLITQTALGVLTPADKAELGDAKNYILNSGFERGLSGIKTYQNAAGVFPVTGTGGTPTHITAQTSTIAPLRDKASLVITNSGSTSAQGEGVSLATFTIDNADKAKPLQINFDYAIASGTYSGGAPTTDSDLEIYVYDITNSTMIQPAGYKMDCAVVGVPCKFKGSFQASSNGTQYRVLAHVPTTNTNAWSVKVDSLVVGSVVTSNGVPASDLVSAGVNIITATTTAPTKGTTTNDVVRWGRIGDHARIKGEYKQTAAGTAGSGDYLFQLPAGLSFDSNKVSFYSGIVGNGANWNTQIGLGSATYSASTSSGAGIVIPYDATHFRLGLMGNTSNGSASGTTGVLSGSYAPLSTNPLSITYDFEAPIQGWSSNVQMSSDTDTRVISYSNYGSPTSTVNSTASTITLPVGNQIDTAGGMSSGIYTAQVSGEYDFAASTQVVFNAGAGATSAAHITALKNGSTAVGQYVYVLPVAPANSESATLNISGTVHLNAGDTLRFTADAQNTSSSLGTTNLSINRRSGSSQIAPTDSVSAKYQITSGQAINTSSTQMVGNVKMFDSTGSYNTSTGFYTCPLNGKYEVKAYIQPGSPISGTSSYITTVLNGTAGDTSELSAVYGNGTALNRIGGSTLVSCLAGQTIGVASVVATANTVSSGSYISFQRVGN